MLDKKNNRIEKTEIQDGRDRNWREEVERMRKSRTRNSMERQNIERYRIEDEKSKKYNQDIIILFNHELPKEIHSRPRLKDKRNLSIRFNIMDNRHLIQMRQT